MRLIAFWRSHGAELASLLGQHVFLVFVSTVAAVVLGVPIGILAARRPRLGAPIVWLANVAQTIPSLAMFGFLLPLPLVGGLGARVRELLELIGLPFDAYAARWPDELSGGQRQRVGVARALAADPPILLMDEPFGALDPITRSEMHEEFRRIQQQVRKTILIVTHDMGEAFAMASRIGVLADGVLAALDAPGPIARSSDPRVRGLLAPLFEATEALRGEAH